MQQRTKESVVFHVFRIKREDENNSLQVTRETICSRKKVDQYVYLPTDSDQRWDLTIPECRRGI
jgi:hypothetical protein